MLSLTMAGEHISITGWGEVVPYFGGPPALWSWYVIRPGGTNELDVDKCAQPTVAVAGSSGWRGHRPHGWDRRLTGRRGRSGAAYPGGGAAFVEGAGRDVCAVVGGGPARSRHIG